MQENHLFEYAVIRVVPRVEREEFINVGVIVYCAKQRFLQAVFALDKKKINALYTELDIEELEAHLSAIVRICLGTKDAGPIGALDMASRFRWLTATRSTILQCSKVHPGFCYDAAHTLLKIHQQMVL